MAIRVVEAAERLGVSRQRVLQLIADRGFQTHHAGMSSPQFGEGRLDESIASKFLEDTFIVEADKPARANLIVHVTAAIPPISPIVIASRLG